jgi:hypothetical protein
MPSFIKPYKHYKADVIERVVEDCEAGRNVESSGGCPADASTMRRWVREFRERGGRALQCMISQLPAGRHGAYAVAPNPLCITLLRQLSLLLHEYRLPEGGGVIGKVNVILTTRNCGFL